MHNVNHNNKILFSSSKIDFVIIATYINYTQMKNLSLVLNIIYIKTVCSRLHCVKSVFRISPCSVRMQENTDMINSEYGRFLGSAHHCFQIKNWEQFNVVTNEDDRGT